MLNKRLPSRLIAQLTLVLLLVCNLTFCVTTFTAMFETSAAMSSCHSQGDEMPEGSDCTISTGLAGFLAQLAAGLSWLLFPLLFCLSLFAPILWSGAIFRWCFRRERGSSPPSWPRLHLEHCVLRN